MLPVLLCVLGVPSGLNDERIQTLNQLRENLKKNEPSVLFTCVNELSLVSFKKRFLRREEEKGVVLLGMRG